MLNWHFPKKKKKIKPANRRNLYRLFCQWMAVISTEHQLCASISHTYHLSFGNNCRNFCISGVILSWELSFITLMCCIFNLYFTCLVCSRATWSSVLVSSLATSGNGSPPTTRNTFGQGVGPCLVYHWGIVAADSPIPPETIYHTNLLGKSSPFKICFIMLLDAA